MLPRLLLLAGALVLGAPAVGCGGIAIERIDGGASSGETSTTGGSSADGSGGLYGSGGLSAAGGTASTGGSGVADCSQDSDGDGLSDHTESATENIDSDLDGTPDYLDPDSDNDSIPDATEGRAKGACGAALDSNGDGIGNFRSTDSDGDGLSDRDEVTFGYDPLLKNTDGDACDDLVEFSFNGKCDPVHRFLIQTNCKADYTATVTLTIKPDIPENPANIQVVMPYYDGTVLNWMTAVPVAVEPSSAGTIENGTITSIAPGARVTFEVHLQVPTPGHYMFGLGLDDKEHFELAYGYLAWIVPESDDSCIIGL